MIYNWFGVHNGLVAAARLPRIARFSERITSAELLLLFLCGGAAAAASGFVRLGIRIPGNAIVLAVIPMVLGLALAPRRMAGFVMSAGAFGTAAALSLSGLCYYGGGAFVSLCLAGPIMDLALTRARGGWRLYLGLVLAGIATNVLALFSRGAGKLLGFDTSGSMRPFATWWPQAIYTYVLCGALAGLIGAICFFQLRAGGEKSEATVEGENPGAAAPQTGTGS